MLGLPPQLPTFWLSLVVVLFLAKHLIADFFAQTSWMALGKEGDAGWVLPLTLHAAIHAVGTLAICLALSPAMSWLAAIDFVIHSALDRAKGLITRHFSATPSQSIFWWLLGIDQSLHALTHFVFALLITAALAQT